MKKKKQLCRAIAIFLVMLLTVGMTAQAAANQTSKRENEAEKTDKSEKTTASLKDAQQEKAQLEKELQNAKNTIKDLKDSKGDVEAKVSQLNSQLIDISSRITTLENQLTAKNNEILNTQEQLEEAKEQESQQYEDMKVRIQFMYENSNQTYLEALLLSKDISEFLNSAEYISEIQNYDRQKLTEYQETVSYIAGVEEQLKQDYEDLQAMKKTVEQQKAAVASLMKQKESELASISSNITDAQSNVDYYAAEIQAQEELIAEIKRAEAEKAAAGVAENPYTGGAFTWPCPSSSRVTSDYGARVSPTGGASSNHKGIDIGADAGAAIVAAAGGVVTSAAYSSAAGNYVMIDHGGGLYTVYMHASALLVSPGQTVQAGQTIAQVGSTGISTGNHLHFGVSLSGSYVSPWGYLRG